MARVIIALAFVLGVFATASVQAQSDYRLGPGDVIRIQVFQNPDLTLETRVSENGAVTYPLIGTVQLGGETLADAEKRIANQLKEGGFVLQPQVTVVLLQNRGNQVSVLGQVNRPGRFPLETFSARLSEMLATAGGIASSGADVAIVTGVRNGKPFRREIDVPALFIDEKAGQDLVVTGGDTIYVHRMPLFYIYGEVQRPGSYRVERAMTVMQALAQGGGPTVRGTENRLRLHRRNVSGGIDKLSPKLSDQVEPDDVLYVNESLF